MDTQEKLSENEQTGKALPLKSKLPFIALALDLSAFIFFGLFMLVVRFKTSIGIGLSIGAFLDQAMYIFPLILMVFLPVAGTTVAVFSLGSKTFRLTKVGKAVSWISLFLPPVLILLVIILLVIIPL